MFTRLYQALESVKTFVLQPWEALKEVFSLTIFEEAVPPIKLLEAAKRGALEEVDSLIRWDADVNYALPDGTTALHLAALKGHCNVVAFLLLWCADISLVMQDGATAFDLAEQNKKIQVLEVFFKNLLENLPENVDDIQKVMAQVQELWLKLKDAELRQAVFLSAVSRGCVSVVEGLLSCGYKIDLVCQNGRMPYPPLHSAARGGYYDVAKVLLEKGGVDVNEEKDGFKAVDFAASYGHVSIVKLLHGWGAHIASSVFVVVRKIKETENTSAQGKYMSILALLLEYDPRFSDPACHAHMLREAKKIRTLICKKDI